MAILTVQQRTQVWRALMRRWSSDGVVCSPTKYQLYDPVANTGAVADTDGWIDAHSGNTSADTVGYNGALAITVRTALSADQKTDLFLAVASMRRGVDYTRAIFGEVN